MDKALDLITERTNGDVTFSRTYSGTLGSEHDLGVMCQSGDIDIVCIGPGQWSDWDEAFKVFDCPFLFTSFDHFDRVLASADLAGLKLRVPDSASLIEIGTAMGYVPTPTAAADQYMSLSQGIVDGADHALWAHQTWKLTEIAKHYSDTRHALQCVFFIMNNDSLASLPEEYQKIVLDTFAEVEKELADQTRKDSDESYVKAEADGVKVIPYEEIDIDSFKQALSGVVDEYSNLAPDLYDIISKLAD